MKGKFSSMWRVSVALVLALSLSLVMTVPVAASPDVTITVATGGEAISADDAETAWTALTGPVIAEGAAGDIGEGTIKLKAPAGFQFNPAKAVTATVTGGATKLTITGSPATPTTGDGGTITITVATPSATNPSTITFSNIEVQPFTKDSLASGNIHNTGSTSVIAGVDGSTIFGTLTEVAGDIAKFTVEDIDDPIALGTASKVKVTALDAGDNTATGFDGEITFTSTDTKAVLPAPYTFTSGDAGIKTFTDGVKLLTLGEQTVTATLTGVSAIKGTQTGITVEDPTDIWVDDDWAGSSSGDEVATGKVFGRNAFATIQAAIDALEADGLLGGTVHVAAGTYAESVVIDGATGPYGGTPLEGITLESIAGAATTTIDASAQTAAAVRAAVQIKDANDVTLGGDGVGFTLIAPDAWEGRCEYGVDIFCGGPMSGVTVEGNTIRGSTNDDSDSPEAGIHFWGAGPFSGITIKDNTLTTTYVTDPTNDKTSAGISAAPSHANGISGTFDGNIITGYSVGMDLTCKAGLPVIQNNEVTGCDYNGIEVDTANAVIDVHSNEVSDCGGNGLAIQGTPASPSIVYKNSFHGNGNGVKVYSGVTATNVVINYNDIYDNTFPNADLPDDPENKYTSWATYENYGVFNEAASGILDAQYNYWGGLSGPDSATYTTAQLATYWAGTALGTGDIAGAVSGSSVVYEPWLTVPYATAYTENICFYASLYPLEEGWNTLSVPLTLKADADTLTEIVAMGDYINSTGDSQNYDIGYSFDSGEWVLITGAYQFEPCKAVYVKMLASANFTMAYSGQLGLPSQILAAGWNLIGSTFGIDKVSGNATLSVGDYGICSLDATGGKTYGADENDGDDADIESWKSVATALDSLGTNASIVVSPSVPGQELAWVTTITAEKAEDSNYMIVGEGYWVFMTAADITYAGFEVTPLYFVYPAP